MSRVRKGPGTGRVSVRRLEPKEIPKNLRRRSFTNPQVALEDSRRLSRAAEGQAQALRRLRLRAEPDAKALRRRLGIEVDAVRHRAAHRVHHVAHLRRAPAAVLRKGGIRGRGEEQAPGAVQGACQALGRAKPQLSKRFLTEKLKARRPFSGSMGASNCLTCLTTSSAAAARLGLARAKAPLLKRFEGARSVRFNSPPATTI